MIEISEEKIKKIVSNILEKTKELNESQTNSLINSIVKKEISSALISEKDLFEGIKYDVYTRTVEYSPIENNVNTSIQDNPTVDITEIYPNVQVWSIFQRKNTPGLIGYDNKDGNPLLYAFKGEDGWKFKTQKDKNKFIYLFEQIVKKFLATHNSDITVVIPSGSPVNNLTCLAVLISEVRTPPVADRQTSVRSVVPRARLCGVRRRHSSDQDILWRDGSCSECPCAASL